MQEVSCRGSAAGGQLQEAGLRLTMIFFSLHSKRHLLFIDQHNVISRHHKEIQNRHPKWECLVNLSNKPQQCGSFVQVSPLSLFFTPAFPSLPSDLHPEAPGQDSVLHRARDRRERSSLAVRPRGKANTYLNASLPLSIPLSLRLGPKPQPPPYPSESLLHPRPALLPFHPNTGAFASVRIMQLAPTL